MKYGYQRRLDIPFDEVDSRVRETLKEQGFGVLTEINVNEAFKEKLNEDFRRCDIVGE
jgi:uncharacterized protein (DUF302 family)